ncbi:amino acid adenylation protein, partial [Lentzea aerocolonigenes]
MGYYRGAALELTDDDPRSVAAALLTAAERAPGRGVTAVDRAGVSTFVSYPELLDRARRILTGLRARGVGTGDPVVLAGLALPDFFAAFWACVLGGAVPAAIAEPPVPGSPAAARLAHTAELLRDPLVLSDVDSWLELPPSAEVAERADDDVVLLMLSSGSTGAPKAAELTQRALVRFAASSRRVLDLRQDEVTLNWLPLDHSGAFLLYHVLEVFAGVTNVHVATEHVLGDPARWPALVAEHRAQHTWAPTFALQLVADAPTGDWDLSGVRTVVCGGEQVLLPVVERFLDALAPCGLDRDVLMPVWGMAETTTAITFGGLTAHVLRKSSLGGELQAADDDVPSRERVTFVSVGTPAHEAEVQVVGDDGAVLGERRIGRLRIRSPRVSPGYVNGERLPADGWLDTGDLAFLADGEVVITGRAKDVIIVNGHNHFAHEIEAVATTVDGVAAGSVAACGVPDETTGSEAVAVFFVSGGDDERIAAEIRKAVHTRLRLMLAHVVPVAAQAFPRTPAGKVQRAALRDRLRTRSVADVVASVAGTPVDARTPFYDAGLSSVMIVRIAEALTRELGLQVAATTLFEHPTVAELSAHLAKGSSTGTAPPVQERPADTRIAIVGMAARLPGAASVGEFWANLRAGVDSTTTFPGGAMGVLDDVDCFDVEFFGTTGREAELTDPAHRLFLQCCYHALEDAGRAAPDPGVRIGVFAGTGMNLFARPGMRAGVDDGDPAAAAQATIGHQPDFLATRVAYRLGLTGPAIGVQTACSTSLVAVHLAVRALLDDEADLALAGAAAVHVPQRPVPGSVLSPSGRCRPFDAAADGTVGGNGVAAVVLKRLDRALADGDTVHAVILGSAVNNDGAGKAGFAAPGLQGQVDVVRAALRRAGVPGDSLSYVEAHGTGTALGDPVEFKALTRALDSPRRGFCTLGSVKANVGHLDSCAGLAGLIKTALMLRERELVPMLGFTTPNPALGLADSPFVVGTSLRPWRSGTTPRRAGVSALGVGGTNAHVVLEEPPARTTNPAAGPALVPLSAHDEQRLRAVVDSFREWASTSTADVADVALSTALGRPHLPRRAFAVGASTGELKPVSTTAEPLGDVVFAFSGQGGAHRGMAKSLYARFPVVRSVIDECDAALPGSADLLLTPGEWPPGAAQPALYAFEVALARQWEAFGVRPALVTGHSLGDYAALTVAGALTLTEGVRLVAARGEEMQRCAPGAMIACSASSAVAEEIAALSGTEIAAVNGAGDHVLAGTPDAVRHAGELLAASGVRHQLLRVDRAFHTSLLDPVLTSLRSLAAEVHWHPLAIPFVSGLDGAVHAAGWRPDADHLVRQARQPVRFDLVLSTVEGMDAVEMGPGAVLTALAGDRWHASQRIPGAEGLLTALGELYVRGADVRWQAVVSGGGRIPLPGTPLARTRFPVGPREPVAGRTTTVPVSGREADVQRVVAKVLGAASVPADVSFFDLGADSLALMSLSREIELALGTRVPVRVLSAEADTCRKVAGLLPPVPGVPEPVPDGPDPEAPDAVPAAEDASVREVVERQLRLGEQLVDLMERQLAVLTGNGRPEAEVEIPRPRAETAPEPVPASQSVPAPTVVPAAGRTVAPPAPTVVPAEPGTAVLAPPATNPTTSPPATPTRQCDFSLYFFGDYANDQATGKYRIITEAAEFGDRHGFHAVWLPERHFHSFGALFPNPSVLAAALASRTSRIRLHAGSVVLPLHHPVRVAEEWSVVDNLSGGRAGLCVASGWHADDFALAPQNFGAHRELMYEQLDTVRRLWRGEAVPARSGTGEAIEVSLHPRPVQEAPPMFVAVLGNPDSYRRAAEQNLGVVTNLMAQTVEELKANIARYRRIRAECGFAPEEGRVVVMVHTFLGADAEEARAEAFRPFCAYLRSSLALLDQVTNSLGFEVDLERTSEEDLEFVLGRAYERYCAGRALIGSEETAAGVVAGLLDAGADEIACFVDFGVPADRVLAALPALDRLRARFVTRQLTPSQRRIWVLEQMSPGRTTYHEPKVVRLDGPLDVPRLTDAVRAAVLNQESLRTVFRDDGGEPHRVVLSTMDIECPLLDFTGADEDDAIAALMATEGKEVFDLAEGPLLLVRLVRLAADRHLLFLVAHHIVFDSSSTSVLVREVAAHYR